jgi:hypothetical protein
MTAPPVRVERRVGQRFPYLLPVSLSECTTAIHGLGFTQDLSSRGVFLFTDAALSEGSEIELTLRMPSEITLGENMRVRCRGRVLRIVKPAALSSQSPATQNSADRIPAENRIGVAVRFESYEYLPDSTEEATTTPRVLALHQQKDDSDGLVPIPDRTASS